jgi:hypothetical protein
MRLVGLFVMLAGMLLLGAGIFIGLPFTGIYLLGFIANAGREAGREVAFFLPVTAIACGFGYALFRLGRHLRRQAP